MSHSNQAVSLWISARKVLFSFSWSDQVFISIWSLLAGSQSYTGTQCNHSKPGKLKRRKKLGTRKGRIYQCRLAKYQAYWYAWAPENWKIQVYSRGKGRVLGFNFDSFLSLGLVPQSRQGRMWRPWLDAPTYRLGPAILLVSQHHPGFVGHT